MIDNIESLIGISIATKNRWEDLAVTLDQLKNQGLEGCQTVVFDDGSDDPVTPAFKKKYPWVTWERSSTSLGSTSSRNAIARILSTPLILQLDNDSFPISGNLLQAARDLIIEEKVAILSFEITISEKLLKKISETFYHHTAVRDFVGCGALIKRKIFLENGGYDERMGFYGEEQELCLRLIKKGYIILYYPSLVIKHCISTKERNLSYRTRLNTRNEILISIWHFPWPEPLLRPLRVLFAGFRNPIWRKYPMSLFMGFIDSIQSFGSKKRTPRLSWKEYMDWRALPYNFQLRGKS